jgi:hypothetical protein
MDPHQSPYGSGRSLPPGPGSAGSSAESDEDPIIRPFMLTNGRTRPLQDGLRIETLLHAAPAALSAPLRFEARRIIELCQAPMSIADLAAGLAAPLGVVRVIVADLITEGYLQIDEPIREFSPALIERIRDRVRAL